MDKRTREQQVLDFAAAEGMFRERLSTLGNLVKVFDATCIQANVLRFIFEEGGCHRDVDLVLPRIAGLPWIQACENTVRKAINFWEKHGIIAIERDRRGVNRQAPNAARLLWSSVLQRLMGEGRSVAPPPAPAAGPSEPPGDHSDRRFSASTSDTSFSDTNSWYLSSDTISDASASNLERSDSKSWYLKPPVSRSPIRVHACAHGLLSLSSSISVVDDVREERRAEFSEVWELAEKARRPLFPAHWPRDPQVKQAFVQAAVLAATLFSENWLMAATRATQAKGGSATWRYWVGCLRNGLVEIERLEPFPNREALASYYSQLTNAVAAVADQVIAECGEAELVPVPFQAVGVGADSQPLSPEAKAFEQKVARHQAARRTAPS